MMYRRFKLIPIVEGHGEVLAVPVLIRRWLRHRNFLNFDVPQLAIRASGCGALKVPHDSDNELGVEHYIEIALWGNPDAILVILDSDKECLSRGQANGLGQELLQRAEAVAQDVPVAVVVANREFEVWFIAATERLRALGEFVSTARYDQQLQIETFASCKGRMQSLMIGQSYSPSVDQARLSAKIPLTPKMSLRSRSFKKLAKDLERLCHDARRR